MSSPGTHPIRILIVDDHAVLSAGLKLVIESRPGMQVIGTAASAAEAIRIARDAQPDIILLDLDLGDDSGFDLMPPLRAVAPETRVILLTGLRDPEEHRRGVLLGAMGLVLKENAIETVIKAVEKVHFGEVWLDRAMIASILNTRARSAGMAARNGEAGRIASLTDRERQIITLLGEGLRNREISERLQISEATVRHHLTSIFAKLSVRDRFELVIFAYRHGLANPPK